MKSQKNGFSTTPSFEPSAKKSWEIEKQEPSKPPIDPVRIKKMEEKAIKVTGGVDNSSGTYPETIQKRSYQETQQSNWEGPKTVFKAGASDYENYGIKIPRYTSPETAAKTYISGDVFDPKQTLFRYDPQTLNIEAELNFRRNPDNAGREFKKIHQEQFPVYVGLPQRKRTFIYNLFRVFDKSKNNREGRYLLDSRNVEQETGIIIKKKLAKNEAMAVREFVALPEKSGIPNTAVEVRLKGWYPWRKNIFQLKTGSVGLPSVANEDLSEEKRKKLEEKYKRTVIVSRTAGGGEQIIGNPRFFKFF